MINAVAYVALLWSAWDSVRSRRPTVLFAAALLLPLTQVMPSPAGPLLAPAHVILIALAVLVHRRRSTEPATGRRLPVRGPVVAMVVALLVGLSIRLLSELTGGWYSTTFYEAATRIWYWFTPFVFYALAHRTISDASTARLLIRLCQVSVAVEGAITIVERATGTGRATAHLGEPNRAGAYFAGAAAFFIVWVFHERGWRRWACLAAWVLAIAGVFNSLSRGGLFAAILSNIVVSGIFFLRSPSKSGVKLAAVAAAIVLVFSWQALVPQYVVDRVLHTFGDQVPEEGDEVRLDGSSEKRLAFWGVAWSLFRDQPIGRGAFTFPDLLMRQIGMRRQAHNIYLQVMVEHGAQGLVALLALEASVILFLFRAYRRSHDDFTKATGLSLLGWWVAHAIAHFFVNPFFMFQVVGQFWLMVACLNWIRDEGGAEIGVGKPKRQLARVRRGPAGAGTRRQQQNRTAGLPIRNR